MLKLIDTSDPTAGVAIGGGVSAREVVKVGPLRVIVTTERLVTSGRWVATFTVMEGFYLIGDGSRVGNTDGAAHTEARHAGEALAVGVAEAMLRAERRGKAQAPVVVQHCTVCYPGGCS